MHIQIVNFFNNTFFLTLVPKYLSYFIQVSDKIWIAKLHHQHLPPPPISFSFSLPSTHIKVLTCKIYSHKNRKSQDRRAFKLLGISLSLHIWVSANEFPKTVNFLLIIYLI